MPFSFYQEKKQKKGLLKKGLQCQLLINKRKNKYIHTIGGIKIAYKHTISGKLFHQDLKGRG